mmetsp:Transcript_109362/g.316102  ORF Transcript_109362/g.316102 Transcript_109362/m.316102 type:complete len:206 (+) Transcript_109362:616-1233(+)
MRMPSHAQPSRALTKKSSKIRTRKGRAFSASKVRQRFCMYFPMRRKRSAAPTSGSSSVLPSNSNFSPMCLDISRSNDSTRSAFAGFLQLEDKITDGLRPTDCKICANRRTSVSEDCCEPVHTASVYLCAAEESLEAISWKCPRRNVFSWKPAAHRTFDSLRKSAARFPSFNPKFSTPSTSRKTNVSTVPAIAPIRSRQIISRAGG